MIVDVGGRTSVE